MKKIIIITATLIALGQARAEGLNDKCRTWVPHHDRAGNAATQWGILQNASVLGFWDGYGMQVLLHPDVLHYVTTFCLAYPDALLYAGVSRLIAAASDQ